MYYGYIVEYNKGNWEREKERDVAGPVRARESSWSGTLQVGFILGMILCLCLPVQVHSRPLPLWDEAMCRNWDDSPRSDAIAISLWSNSTVAINQAPHSYQYLERCPQRLKKIKWGKKKRAKT